MLAVGYARVSVEGEDVGNQVKAIEEYTEAT
jgi:DNA invertase Pin-like site-specific DNA recombinase